MSVCNECHGFVKKLEEFDERCGKVDTMFNELVSSDEAILDSDEIFLQLCRRKFGLDKREVRRNLKKTNSEPFSLNNFQIFL